MAWLTRGDEVLASLERGRRRPDPESGTASLRARPLLVTAPLFGALDVAWCRPVPSDDPANPEQLQVCRLVCLGRFRPAVPGFGPPVVIIAAGGAFERWRLAVGDRLIVRGD